jgi:transposase
MAISLPDARQLSDEVLEALRLRALHGWELGFTQADVADRLGVSHETVSRWWTAYAEGGLGAIPGDRTGRPIGSGRTLSDERARHIQERIDHHSPEELGIRAAVWSRKAVRDLIGAECGIDLPVRTVGAYLKRWGSTAKVPRRHAQDQDPEEVSEWLDETYRAIERWAGREDAEIHWCDQTGAAADEQPHKGCARIGHPAYIEVPGPHLRINRVATITNEGAVHFLTSKETMTAALFITFLEELSRETARKVFLILDRLPAHEAKAVEEWVAEPADRIELFWLPESAPELNADESMNNDLKGSINAEGLPHSSEELRSRIERFMNRLLQLPERVRNYFRHPCVQYAAAGV